MKNIKFGFCVPIFANPGMVFFRTPGYQKLDWDSIKKNIILIENLGFDSIFIADHVFLGNEGDIWECISLMSAIAAITKKVDIAPIHLCNNFRHPGLVAKSLSTISHISNGRVILFYDYGWRKKEFDAYGISFNSSEDSRVTQMEEGIQIIKGMLNKEKFSFDGSFYKIKDAICNPKPIKKIPLWMGETKNQKMVESIVKYADVFNVMPCSVDDFKKNFLIVKKECEKQKRNFDTMQFSLETQVLIRETKEEVDHCLNQLRKNKKSNINHDQDIEKQLKINDSSLEFEDIKKICEDRYLVGTPEQIRSKIDRYTEIGVTHFMLWFMDYPDQKGIRLFAEKVISQ